MLEAVGLGAFALGGASALARELGMEADAALAVPREMGRVSIGRHRDWLIPALGAGAPAGIDLLAVLELNVLPAIASATLAREGGLLGVGLAQPPWECFYGALPAFLDHCRGESGA
jgi:hypothetical protein